MKDKAPLGGAVLAAVGASACCWGPMLFGALGLGAFGLGRFFEAARPYLMAATTLLLAAGFYLVYFRKPSVVTAATPTGADACGCGPAEVPSKALRNKIMLWTTTALAVGFLALPHFI